jgi:hypothetical protein
MNSFARLLHELLVIFVVYYKRETFYLHINPLSFCTHCLALR